MGLSVLCARLSARLFLCSPRVVSTCVSSPRVSSSCVPSSRFLVVSPPSSSAWLLAWHAFGAGLKAPRRRSRPPEHRHPLVPGRPARPARSWPEARSTACRMIVVQTLCTKHVACRRMPYAKVVRPKDKCPRADSTSVSMTPSGSMGPASHLKLRKLAHLQVRLQKGCS